MVLAAAVAGRCKLATTNLLVAVVGRLWDDSGALGGDCRVEGEGARLIPIPENSRLVTDI